MTRAIPRLAKVGDRIGPDLTVLDIIDGGSVEPVYIIWHHRAWCPMACKVFATLQRAQREAEVLATFAHPNIVRALEVCRPGHLLMPFLEGSSLSTLIDRAKTSPIAIPDALRIAIHIGSALQHVHDRGYLHLDIKSDNVIVARGGLPVLFDFGSARKQTAPRPRDVIGTDPYIAPEECLLRKVGPAADVFGLGVTLYEMLTGVLPFPKGTKTRPFPQVVLEPVPARQRRPRVSIELDQAVLSCLAWNPSERPSLDALLPVLNDLIRSGPRMWPAGFEPVDRTNTCRGLRSRARRVVPPQRTAAAL